MMTTLTQLVWDCKAIGGMDKLILMGWVEQVPDGSDIACASKETVADFVGLDIRTVQRHTKTLVKRGWLADTGGRKQWKFGWTPVYQVNLELLIGQPVNLTGGVKMSACQIDRQGSNGSRFIGLDVLSSSSPADVSGTGVPPVVAYSTSKEIGQTENREPKTVEPKPTPHGQRKSCPDCGEPLQRDVNHFLVCKVAKGNSTLDEYLLDRPIRPIPPNPDPIMDDGYGSHGQPLFPSINSPQAEAARQKVDAERQKSVQSIIEKRKPKLEPTATHAHNPVPPKFARKEVMITRDPPCPTCGLAKGDFDECECDIVREREIRPTGY